MIFTLVDVILILIFFSFIAWGFFMGLIRSIGAIVGLAAGTWAAGHFFQPIASWLTPVIMGHAITAKIIAFMAVYIVVNRLVVVIFHFIDKGFGLLSIIPFMKSLNRIGGVILGAAEGLLTLGIILYVIAKFAPNSGFVTNSLNSSQIAHYLVMASKFLTALLPDAFNQIKSVF
jgi:membrane protein required for colicin V production